MKHVLLTAALFASTPAHADDEAQSKCQFMVETMKGYANERAQEEPEKASEYLARNAKIPDFVAKKRPDILCDKDLYHFLRVVIDTGDWWQI
jgi:hypothetical protein